MCVFPIIKFASVVSAFTIMMSLKFFATQPGLYQHLKEAGFPVEGALSQKPWGEYTFTVHDPDGHVLEFDDSHGV